MTKKMKTICIANQKGGVAKTTTAVTIAGILADQGKRVLLVDADPQGNTTMHLGLNPEEYQGLCEVLVGDQSGQKKPLKDIIEQTAHEIDLIPPPLTTIELRLMSIMTGRESLLRRALASVFKDYDFAVIDSPPHMGLLQVNALLASDVIIIPFQAELFGSRSLKEFQRTLNDLKEGGADVPKIGGMLPTRVKTQSPLLNKMIVNQVREIFGDILLPISIRETVSVAEAAAAGKPLSRYAPQATATQDYISLVKHMISTGII